MLTPHIGGVVEFFQLQDGILSLVAEIPGYTSHVIRARNLDMAAAGDFDADDIIELLLPNQSLTSLGAIQRVEGGAKVDWELSLDGKLSTNLSIVSLGDELLGLGVGRQDGSLRLWLLP